ncbi:MAG: hypothetical protein ACRC62_30775, partial [Microcoleus sp.]
GYRNPGDLRAGYPKFFRNVVSQYIGEGLHYLALTPAGQKTIANLYGNLLTVEQEIAASATQSAQKLPPKLLGNPRVFQFDNLDRFAGWRDISIQNHHHKIAKGFLGIGN